jgi:phage-related protein
MGNEVLISVRADSSQAKGEIKGFIDSADKGKGPLAALRSGLGSVATIASGFVVGQGLLKLPGLLGGATSAASELNEAANKAQVVFGPAVKGIEELAATSAKSFGIAKADALGYAGTLGTILTASGLSQDAAAGMSGDLVKLAADLASFNNIPIDQALEKLRSGLVGEAEPMRTVGVLLSAAAVEEKAYAMGIAETGAALTEGQKVQARYALILEQTATAQGDFARTSEGDANQARIQAARWADVSAAIGQKVLPVKMALSKVMLNQVIPGVEKLIGIATPLVNLFGAALSGNLQKAHGEFVKLPPSLHGVGQVLFEIGSFIRTEVVPAVRDHLIPALVDIGRFILTDVRPHVEEFGGILREVVVATIQDWVMPALTTLKQGWDDLWPVLREHVLPVLKDIGIFLLEHKPLLIGVAAAILLLLNPWLLVVAGLVIVLAKWDEIKLMFTQTIPDALDSVITKVEELPIIGAIFTDTWNTVRTIVETALGVIKIQIELALATIKNTFLFWKAVFSGDWDAAWNALKDQAKAIWDALAGLLGLALDAIKALVGSKLEMLKGIGSDIGSAVAGGVTAGFELVKNGIVGALNWIIMRINDFIRKINSVLSGGGLFGSLLGKLGISLPQIPEVPLIGPGSGVGTGDIYVPPNIPLGGGGRVVSGGSTGERLVALMERQAAALEEIAARPTTYELDGRTLAEVVGGRLGTISDLQVRGG